MTHGSDFRDAKNNVAAARMVSRGWLKGAHRDGRRHLAERHFDRPLPISRVMSAALGFLLAWCAKPIDSMSSPARLCGRERSTPCTERVLRTSLLPAR